MGGIHGPINSNGGLSPLALHDSGTMGGMSVAGTRLIWAHSMEGRSVGSASNAAPPIVSMGGASNAPHPSRFTQFPLQLHPSRPCCHPRPCSPSWGTHHWIPWFLPPPLLLCCPPLGLQSKIKQLTLESAKTSQTRRHGSTLRRSSTPDCVAPLTAPAQTPKHLLLLRIIRSLVLVGKRS